jgi:hypothetical protein
MSPVSGLSVPWCAGVQLEVFFSFSIICFFLSFLKVNSRDLTKPNMSHNCWAGNWTILLSTLLPRRNNCSWKAWNLSWGHELLSATRETKAIVEMCSFIEYTLEFGLFISLSQNWWLSIYQTASMVHSFGVNFVWILVNILPSQCWSICLGRAWKKECWSVLFSYEHPVKAEPYPCAFLLWHLRSVL